MSSDASSVRSFNFYRPPDAATLAARLSRIEGQEFQLRKPREPTKSPSNLTPIIPVEEEPEEYYKDALSERKKELKESYPAQLVDDFRWEIVDSNYWKLEASHYCKALRQRKVRQPHKIRESIVSREYWEMEWLHYRSLADMVIHHNYKVQKRNLVGRINAQRSCSPTAPRKRRKRATGVEMSSINGEQDTRPVSSRLRSSTRVVK